jgi:FMN phosphatase YigB (HAD superfamily)
MDQKRLKVKERLSEARLVALDLFGTVYKLQDTPKQEIRDYIAHVRKPEWSPLTLPDSWRELQLHPDSLDGIRLIAEKYMVVSCSNAPYEFTRDLFIRSGLDRLVEITDIAKNQCFKPHPDSYRSICQQFPFEPREVLMVTGNEGSPDVEGARTVGMQSILIRQPGTPQTIIELAELLGC